MSDPSRVVYLEDLESPAAATSRSSPASEEKETTEKSAASVSTATTAKNASQKTQTTTTATLKRQRTLLDMFAGPKGAEPGNKKPKLATAGSSAEVSRTQSLNAIPFSLSAFTSSFSDEEKRLLALECETMGKSWYRPFLCSSCVPAGCAR